MSTAVHVRRIAITVIFVFHLAALLVLFCCLCKFYFFFSRDFEHLVQKLRNLLLFSCVWQAECISVSVTAILLMPILLMRFFVTNITYSAVTAFVIAIFLHSSSSSSSIFGRSTRFVNTHTHLSETQSYHFFSSSLLLFFWIIRML